MIGMKRLQAVALLEDNGFFRHDTTQLVIRSAT